MMLVVPRKKGSGKGLRFRNDFSAAFPQRGNVDVPAFIFDDVRGMVSTPTTSTVERGRIGLPFETGDTVT